ncbi:DUF624 domain-containing protein [Agarivorans sp. Alg241-V36]|uniref:DUF624 domain-containing protein n=1 Tax=Agarivorans sp. Alg241-V36 TaxID=2305992 RepID=UPI00351B2734
MNLTLSSNHSSPLIQLCYWITRLAWINLLMLMFSLIGGVLFGLTPALIASYKAIGHYQDGGHQLKFGHFYRLWKANLGYNKQGFALLALSFALLWYAQLLLASPHNALNLIAFSLYPLTGLTLCIYSNLVLLAGTDETVSQGKTNAAVAMLVKTPGLSLCFPFSLLGCLLIYLMSPITGLIFLATPALLLSKLIYNQTNG